AQDFNRLLDTILGYTAMLAQRMADQPEAAHIVEEIARASEQAAGLSRQLFTFSRGDVEGHQPLHLSTVVHDMERILERIIDTDIRYEADSPEDVWPVSADPAQVEQVLLNFMINARDALENGGTIKVRYENVTLEDGLAGLDLKPGSYVLLSVSDDGPGIDPNHLNNIFDPFFTTKEDEKAAGLGLSTVHGIMKQNHGAVLAKSAPGEGATFCAYFPRSYEEPGLGPNGEPDSPEDDFRKAA
ncbi:MAG: hypothetical protein HKN21_00360, partial [Candidatus Eisenbacteria bacterium]|nr:hypothetical protein [Candidatus Eisenbacteria bacterium]